MSPNFSQSKALFLPRPDDIPFPRRLSSRVGVTGVGTPSSGQGREVKPEPPLPRGFCHFRSSEMPLIPHPVLCGGIIQWVVDGYFALVARSLCSLTSERCVIQGGKQELGGREGNSSLMLSTPLWKLRLATLDARGRGVGRWIVLLGVQEFFLNWRGSKEERKLGNVPDTSLYCTLIHRAPQKRFLWDVGVGWEDVTPELLGA